MPWVPPFSFSFAQRLRGSYLIACGCGCSPPPPCPPPPSRQHVLQAEVGAVVYASHSLIPILYVLTDLLKGGVVLFFVAGRVLKYLVFGTQPSLFKYDPAARFFLHSTVPFTPPLPTFTLGRLAWVPVMLK